MLLLILVQCYIDRAQHEKDSMYVLSFLALAISNPRMGQSDHVTAKFVYMAHNFILLWLNLFDLMIDRGGVL